MSIADKMKDATSSIPPDIHLALVQRRLADTIRYFQELRQLYLAATGIDWIPSEMMPDDVTAISGADEAWLADLGVKL